ncbi:MAG: hypothetical protein DBX46_01225 [Clostridiales bacterium]|nr:MAG: hypothetical protein DBX46_01225 [Clostridiales bacterium]
MKCEKCGKNEAVIRCIQIIGGKKTVMNLCESCAREDLIGDVSTRLLNDLCALSALLGGNETGSTTPDMAKAAEDFYDKTVKIPVIESSTDTSVTTYDLDALEGMLKEAVEEENYEYAATLRDRIKDLKQDGITR